MIRNIILSALIASLIMALPIWEMSTVERIIAVLPVTWVSFLLVTGTEKGSP